MWYSNVYRRHLCDMHIADWDERFLSLFSPEEYVENLKRAKIEGAMLYLQSHAGLCYFPTKVGVMHKALVGRENMIKRTEELCHKNGIAVVGYYSINFNTKESERHPEWRMVNEGRFCDPLATDTRITESTSPVALARGKRYGLCCPNNREYRKFVYKQIDEMLSYFDLDGIFFDMPFWPYTCQCDACKERYLSETSVPLPYPDPDLNSESGSVFMLKKQEWMGEWVQSITDHVKSINPGISVEFNYAGGIGGTSDRGTDVQINSASDYVGGDLYGGISNHTLACKFYKNITKNQPFEYMFSRCKPDLFSHTLTKSTDELLLEVYATVSHHGASLVIDAIDPVGTQDRRIYEKIGKVFEETSVYEPYMRGEMLEDVGLYYGIRSRYGAELCGFDSIGGCIGASKAMIFANIPFGVTGNFHDIDKYRAIVIPMIADIESDSDRILSYVERGGTVYLSGARCPSLISALTGGSVLSYTEEKKVYVAPTCGAEDILEPFNAKYPLPFDLRAPVVKNVGRGKILATLTLPYTKPTDPRFASIHSDPPGIATEIPAIVEGEYGNGKFIWSALPIEAVDMDEYREIFIKILRRLIAKESLSFISSAPADVEVTLFNDADDMIVHIVNLCERTVIPDTAPFEIGIKCDVAPARIEVVPSGAAVSFEMRDGYAIFKTEPMHIFASYRIVK